jgi:hypothetical protein
MQITKSLVPLLTIQLAVVTVSHYKKQRKMPTIIRRFSHLTHYQDKELPNTFRPII